MADNYDRGSLFASFSDGPRPSGLMQTVSPYDFTFDPASFAVVDHETAQRYCEQVYAQYLPTWQAVLLERGGKAKTVQKTFCDLCETEVVNYRVRLHLSVLHTTKDSEQLGEDEFKPIDICRTCSAKPVVLLELITQKLRMYNEQPVPMDEPAPLVEASRIELLDGPGDGRAIEAPRVQIGPDGAVELNQDPD